MIILPNTLWQEEFLNFIKNKRALIIKILIPLILSSPILIPGVPNEIKAGIFILTILFIGIFSSTIGLIQLKDSKMLQRLAILPISKKRLILEYIFIKGFMDSIKFFLPLVIFIIINLKFFSVIMLSWLLICYFSTIFTANSLGILIAVISGSSGEAHLYAIISVLFIIGISGIFGTLNFIILEITSSILPFKYFSDSISFFLTGQSQSLLLFAPISCSIILILMLFISNKLFKF